MNTLLTTLCPQIGAFPEIPFTATNWQSRLVPEAGVLLSDGKTTAEKRGVGNLALQELEIVHRLADAINSERPARIDRVFEKFGLSLEILEPLLAAINLELAITGRRKKFAVIENGWFKARTFDGGIVFQRTLGK